MTDPASDDASTMARLRDGDDLALNLLMDKWQKPLIHYLIRMTGNYHDAVDLAQETFVKVYQHRASYKPVGNFSTWLFTIATRLARNRARWRRRHPETPIDTGSNEESAIPNPIETIASTGMNPAEQLESGERIRDVRLTVQRLPVELRESLVLFEYQDMSYVDIAKVLKCSAKAVETRIYRARKLLKSWLKNT